MKGMKLIPEEIIFRRSIPPGLVIIATCALGTAYVAELVFQLKPCDLCLYQRIPYIIIGVLGVAAYLFNSNKFIMRATGTAGMVLLAGSGLAIYHMGVEQHWWISVTSCGAGQLSQELTMGEFQALLQQKPVIACDGIAWSLFGVSMATYNAAVSLIFGLIGLWCANRMRCF